MPDALETGPGPTTPGKLRGWWSERVRRARGPRPSNSRWPSPRKVAVAAMVLGATAWVGWERCGIRGCPNVDQLAAYQPGGASVLLDREGKVFARLAPVQHEVVPLDSLPPEVAAAFLAVEDKRFFEHEGVDWRRVGGAVAANVKAGGVSQGFSTITMQLARNIFPERLPGQQRTLGRKLLEIRVAREIEERFSKQEILELYLNHIYFGGGAYGVEAAARDYFHRSASRLTLPQAALLAALPKGPTLYNPRRHPERARERRNLVLGLMAEQGRITSEQAEAAREARIGVRRESPSRWREETGPAPYFVEAVRRVLEERFGEDLYTSPLRVHTTLDRSAQRGAEEELEAQLRRIERGALGRYNGRRYSPGSPFNPAGTRYVQGAVVVLDADSGDVLALVGGRDFHHSRFDRATQARRLVGSAFKPFVFATAIAEGYAPSQRIADAPIRMDLPGGEVWEPSNFGGEVEGAVTLREALVRSKNLPTIRLALAVGLDDVRRTARRSGVRAPLPDQPSLALGTAGMSPLELAQAYTVFANLGEATRARLVLRVESREGKVLWEPEVFQRRALDPGVAYLVTDVLREAVSRGTGAAVRQAGFPGSAAGKTGTTDGGTDAWFAGYTPDRVAVVWIGFDEPRAIVSRATGGRLAAPVWGRLMRRLESSGASGEFERPDNVLTLATDPATGFVLAEGCSPSRGRPDEELFLQGWEPASVCPRGGEDSGGPDLWDRVWAWVRGRWTQFERWAASHFGRESQVPAAVARERYLGAPRLPRADEIVTPRMDPRLYEMPDFGEQITVPLPEVEPLMPETLSIDLELTPISPEPVTASPETPAEGATAPQPAEETPSPPRADSAPAVAVPRDSAPAPAAPAP